MKFVIMKWLPVARRAMNIAAAGLQVKAGVQVERVLRLLVSYLLPSPVLSSTEMLG
jgi:hypothetical protein